jgi:hypothetical protein
VLHPPPPHFDIPDFEIPEGIEVPPEVVINPPHEPEPEPEPEPEEAEKIVIVRKGEGLSQVAQRLGRPGGIADVRVLRAANIPHGPENDWESTSTGNLTIPGQPKRGLQPGDSLFVPHEWL